MKRRREKVRRVKWAAKSVGQCHRRRHEVTELNSSMKKKVKKRPHSHE